MVRAVAAVLLVPLLVSTGGCRALALILPEPMKNVPAEYPYLADKRVCIVVRAPVFDRGRDGVTAGEGAAMLRKIGSAARKEIESMSGRKVFLELRVKVDKDWRDDENALRRLGYKIKKK